MLSTNETHEKENFDDWYIVNMHYIYYFGANNQIMHSNKLIIKVVFILAPTSLVDQSQKRGKNTYTVFTAFEHEKISIA